ncbi:hypothetical protein GCM10010331_02870 [Streptomyces xanthochromogenes]|nr:hypothetical protein GCM10010331_02870 [Streptomyces xanthochromogenes]
MLGVTAARTGPPPHLKKLGEGIRREAKASRILTLSLPLPPLVAGWTPHPGRTEPDA